MACTYLTAPSRPSRLRSFAKSTTSCARAPSRRQAAGTSGCTSTVPATSRRDTATGHPSRCAISSHLHPSLTFAHLPWRVLEGMQMAVDSLMSSLVFVPFLSRSSLVKMAGNGPPGMAEGRAQKELVRRPPPPRTLRMEWRRLPPCIVLTLAPGARACACAWRYACTCLCLCVCVLAALARAPVCEAFGGQGRGPARRLRYAPPRVAGASI